MVRAVRKFLALEAAPSLLLLVIALLAMAVANSPLQGYYHQLRSHDAVLVINEGLMALFFLCIGIEIRKEMKEGCLSHPSDMALPLAATFGGMAAPAMIYAMFNWHDGAMRGWAIPTATDVAFSLAVLQVFKKRVPRSLWVFLLSIAIFDDLGAVAIVAVFYAQAIYWPSLAVALLCLMLLCIYSVKMTRPAPFIFAGAALWVALLDAGINATVAGAALGLLLPVTLGVRVLKFLHNPVAFLIVPLFVFANSGIAFGAISGDALGHGVTMGVALGLLLGKPLGIFISSLIVIRLKAAPMLAETTWMQLFSVAVLCGIGFTMSLFIGSLAFDDDRLTNYMHLGVMTGSLASAVAGAICMAVSVKTNTKLDQ